MDIFIPMMMIFDPPAVTTIGAGYYHKQESIFFGTNAEVLK
jgi:hypothetical protein